MKKYILLGILIIAGFCAISAFGAGTENVEIKTEEEVVALTVEAIALQVRVDSIAESRALSAKAWHKLGQERWENEFWIRYAPIFTIFFLTLIGVLNPRKGM